MWTVEHRHYCTQRSYYLLPITILHSDLAELIVYASNFPRKDMASSWAVFHSHENLEAEPCGLDRSLVTEGTATQDRRALIYIG